MKRFSALILIIILCLVVTLTVASAESTGADRSIAITTEQLIVSIGKPLKLTAEITRLSDDAPVKTILTWTSEDESIAKVNAQGSITGIAPGIVRITCQAKDNPEIKSSVSVTVTQPVKTAKPEKTIYLLLLGSAEEAAKGNINVQIMPENATVKECSFSSSDDSIVTVDENGNLQAIAEGKAKITITPLEEGTKVKSQCTVIVGQGVTSISIPAKQTIEKNKTFTIKPEIAPDNAYEKRVEYTSSNEKVATVSKSGAIRGIGCGTAKITCTAIDGSGVVAECEVTVIQRVTKVSGNDRRIIIFEGNEQKWSVSVNPSDATNKKLSYSSDNSYIASVDSDGRITGKNGGKTRITATSTDGSKKTCSVEIIVEPSVPLSLDSIGHGIFNYNLLGLTVTNQCSTATIVDFDFDMTFYDWGGSEISSGSYSLGSQVKIGPHRQKTIKRTVYGAGQAYKTVITITGVKFSDGSYWSIPYSDQETWSFTRN